MDLENNIEFEPVIDFEKDKTPPGPLKPRICPCGCEEEFQPRRRDQIFYNSQHANYAYNHGKRKEKNKNRLIEEKILRNNDNILERHYNSDQVNGISECFLKIIRADGFDFGYHVGISQKDGIDCYFTYRYYYSIFKDEDKLDKLKINKR